MNIEEKIFYNENSANRLGWTPQWFGCNDFDEDLVQSIAKWQKEHGLQSDGLCGPATYRRIWTERESELLSYESDEDIWENADSNIVFNNNFFPIKWKNVIRWFDKGGLQASEKNFSSREGEEQRDIRFFVNHWDVCLNSRSCYKVLEQRGISIHFLIDNNGTIYQTMDMQNIGWHASGRSWNAHSVGVEIANAYYPRYQSWYVKNGFGERPLISDAYVHGKKLEPFTGFYNVQIAALQALWEAVHIATGIPLDCPMENGKLVTTVHKPSQQLAFKGFINHYNLTENKIDCAGLDLPNLLQEVKNNL